MQSYAERVVAAIKKAEYGEDGENITAEIARRKVWNSVAAGYDEEETGQHVDGWNEIAAQGYTEEEKKIESNFRPIIEENIAITFNQGVYTYQGFAEPSFIIFIDPGYHWCIRFNRFYAYGDGPQFEGEIINDAGDRAPNSPGFYPGNQTN